eukprot:Lankesteria_metandrocarpae@DN4284_c0_g1_i1.p2
MSASCVEQLRQQCEDLEQLEKVGALLLKERQGLSANSAGGGKQAVIAHVIKEVVNDSLDKSQNILRLFGDEDGLRKHDIAVLGGSVKSRIDLVPGDTPDDSVNVWSNFYDKLKEIRDFYKSTTMSNDLSVMAATEPEQRSAAEMVQEMLVLRYREFERVFTGEEDLGRYVDMMLHFNKFCNLTKYRRYREQEHQKAEIARLRRKAERSESADGVEDNCNKSPPKIDHSQIPHFDEIDYVAFLRSFQKLHEIPRHCKYRDVEYEEYVRSLEEYVEGFFFRINPLIEARKIHRRLAEFGDAWDSGTVMGWSTYTHKLPLYALPTDQLLATQATFSAHKGGKKYKKTLATLQARPVKEQTELVDRSEARDKTLAESEYKIQFYYDLLSPVIEKTIERLQTKQSRSARELDTELEKDILAGEIEEPLSESSSDEDSGDDDDDKPVYNPLNLPLGWDGKPIPFWLYKLHGLGQEYKCEICGNQSYWGRRAFERHFQEWRHAYGMRCLKIPNTAHFKEVTKIEDAITLYEKLKKEAEIKAFDSEHDVECEDSAGNVMSAKAMQDLHNQGLL